MRRSIRIDGAMVVMVRCDSCGVETTFDQPYVFHAGLGNVGFLYDDAGTSTLVWSTFDAAYVDLVGPCHPWALSESAQQVLEAALAPTPTGGRWRFGNPARCPSCGQRVRGPMTQDIHYLVFPGSPVLGHLGLESVLLRARARAVMSTDRVYCDFNGEVDEGTYTLDTCGSRGDLARLGIELERGMRLKLWSDDADDHGKSDAILVDAVADYVEPWGWVARVDPATWRHASDDRE
jgi:hypothetical protein